MSYINPQTLLARKISSLARDARIQARKAAVATPYGESLELAMYPFIKDALDSVHSLARQEINQADYAEFTAHAAKEASAYQHLTSVETSLAGTSTMQCIVGPRGLFIKSWEFSPAADEPAVDEVESRADAAAEFADKLDQLILDRITGKSKPNADKARCDQIFAEYAARTQEDFVDKITTDSRRLSKLGYVHTGQSPAHFVDKIREESPWLLGARINERGRTEVDILSLTTPMGIFRILRDCARWSIKEIEFKLVASNDSFLCVDQGHAGGWKFAYKPCGSLSTYGIGTLRAACRSANAQLDTHSAESN